MSTEQQPQQLTVKEALEQGYTHFATGVDVDDLKIYPLCKASYVEREEGEMVVLCEKETKILSVTAKDIYEHLTDSFAIDNEVEDEEDHYGDIIRGAVSWDWVARQINERLRQRPVYFPTDIKLIP